MKKITYYDYELNLDKSMEFFNEINVKFKFIEDEFEEYYEEEYCEYEKKYEDLMKGKFHHFYIVRRLMRDIQFLLVVPCAKSVKLAEEILIENGIYKYTAEEIFKENMVNLFANIFSEISAFIDKCDIKLNGNKDGISIDYYSKIYKLWELKNFNIDECLSLLEIGRNSYTDQYICKIDVEADLDLSALGYLRIQNIEYFEEINEFMRKILKLIFECISNIKYILLNLLNENGIEVCAFNTKYIKEVENTLKNIVKIKEVDRTIDTLKQCVLKDPYNINVYEYVLKFIGDEDGQLTTVADFFRMDLSKLKEKLVREAIELENKKNYAEYTEEKDKELHKILKEKNIPYSLNSKGIREFIIKRIKSSEEIIAITSGLIGKDFKNILLTNKHIIIIASESTRMSESVKFINLEDIKSIDIKKKGFGRNLYIETVDEFYEFYYQFNKNQFNIINVYIKGII